MLTDGRVFIYGGRDAYGAVDSAEIFDPATGQSVYGERPTAELHTAVASHTATRLRDGRVLVAGGGCAQSNCGAYARAWIFDPADRSPGGAINLQARPDMCMRREQHTASLLADGTVLVAGGIDDRMYAVATVERFIPGIDRWATAPAMVWARGRHTATTLQDGRILVTGGHGARNPHPGDRLECSPPPPPPPGYHMPAFPPAGAPPGYPPGPPRPRPAPPPEPYLEYVTIASAELYDPASDTWVEVAPMHRAREQHSAALLPDGRVLVSGGYIDHPQHCEEIDQSGMETAEIWDPRTNVWTMTPPMAMYRVDHSSTLLPDGRILLVGGGGGDRKARLDPVEIWPPPAISP